MVSPKGTCLPQTRVNKLIRKFIGIFTYFACSLFYLYYFRYNYFMAIFSISFLLLSYWLTNWFGPVGFILANCTNMMSRICYSVQFILKQYRGSSKNPLTGLIPGRLFIGSLLVCGVACKISQAYVLHRSVIYHIFVGSVCTSITVLVWLFENRNITNLLLERFRPSKTKPKTS